MLHKHEMIVGRNKADKCNKITCANKSNSIVNRLKIIYYAAKSSPINVKATEFKSKQIHTISFLLDIS